MLIPKTLTFSGVGRFVEEQKLDFTNLPSLIQVEGQNNNTGGSSGAGKSTLFQILQYNLGLNDLPISILQSRLTKIPIHTVGTYDLDGVPIIIERGKSKLSVTIGDEVTCGSAKLAEEKIDQILGMPRDLFRKILVKRQGEGGFFLQMTPSEVHKFLTSCLGLEQEQSKIIVLDTKLETLGADQTSWETSCASYKASLEATKDAITSLGIPPLPDYGSYALEGWQVDHEKAVKAKLCLKAEHEIEFNVLESVRPKIETAPFNRSAIVSVENEINSIVSIIVQTEKTYQDRNSYIKDRINELQMSASMLQNEEHTRQNNVKNQISELQIKIRDINNAEIIRQNAVKSQIVAVDTSLAIVYSDIRNGDSAKTTASSLVQELHKIKAYLCPTCEQSWASEAAKQKEAEILQKLQDYKKLIVAGIEASKALEVLNKDRSQLELEFKPIVRPELVAINTQIDRLKLESAAQPISGWIEVQKDISDLQEGLKNQAIPEVIELKLKKDFKNQELQALRQLEKNHQTEENAKKQQEVVIHAEKQTELRKKHQMEMNLAVSAEHEASERIRDLENRIKSFEDAKQRFETTYKKLSDQLIKYRGLHDEANARMGVVLEEIELATESKKVIKSYLSTSFEDALSSISDVATGLVRGIPNMATASIEFDSLKETKEGRFKEEVNCLLSMDGEIGIPVKSLSGGERSSTDLAIDLAVINFIEERTGKGCNVIYLDESFTGLDSQCCEDAIEMLKNCSMGKKIFLIDHNPIVAQSIESKITVVRDGLTSRIIQ